jgi:transposase
MRRTEQAQGLRLMKFEEVYGRLQRGVLSQAEAAEVLGVSERTFRRWRARYGRTGRRVLPMPRAIGCRGSRVIAFLTLRSRKGRKQ